VSFLAPLFGLGLTAIALPLLLHLARRRTQRELSWSSQLFLRAAPPRLERRRWIEDWLLLALRALVVVAVVAAFARPFFTRPLPALIAAPGVRKLILIDTSASMQRAGLFAAAVDHARAELRGAAPGDRVAVMTFAQGRPRTIIGFEDWAAWAPGQRAAQLDARLAGLAAGWGGTDLGAALIAAAEAVVDDEQSEGAAGARVSSMTLLSDLQAGARLGALGQAWPAHVVLRAEPLTTAPSATNLALHPLPARADLAPAGPGPERLRVRVEASGGGARTTARVHWADGGDAVAVALAPGESRIIDAPARPGAANAAGTLVLEGDDDGFDNQLAVEPAVPVVSRIVYIGDDDERGAGAGSFYFLSRAFPRTRAHAPEVIAHLPDDPLLAGAIARADLVVATVAVLPAVQPALRAFLAAGHTWLFAPADAAAGAGLAAVLTMPGAATIGFRAAPAAGEAVLTDLDLTHPLLAPFAAAGAADFTHVRFWRHRVLDLGGGGPARVLARFDGGDPAWVIVPVGRGQVLVMTSGWDSRDSQLGISSKLVPLLWNLLESSGGAAADLGPHFVGDPLVWTGPSGAAGPSTMVRPDGRRIDLSAAATSYDETDLPGFYRLIRGAGAGAVIRTFAVAVPPAESLTAAMPIEQLERAHITLTDGSTPVPPPAASGTDRAAQDGRRRSAFFAGLEAEQKPWRWALGAALLLLLAESLVSARSSSRSRSSPEVTS
jgi:hypothetical protein